MRVRFLPYDSKNSGNAPPQKSITARASCCSDRDCDFASENKLNASVPPNDHPRDQKVPCLLIPILKALRLPVKRGQESADALAPGEVIFAFSFQPGKFLIRFFVSLIQHCGTSIEFFCWHIMRSTAKLTTNGLITASSYGGKRYLLKFPIFCYTFDALKVKSETSYLMMALTIACATIGCVF